MPVQIYLHRLFRLPEHAKGSSGGPFSSLPEHAKGRSGGPFSLFIIYVEWFMRTITKDMTITEVLNVDPMIANILTGQGMHCLFCGAASGESLEQACAVHGIEEEQMNLMIAQINDFLAE